ncbi:uroporphyrinogen-III C-methyltransferase [Paraburkholderia fungorum]|jgi:uroporphyrin-III C-methyltransferase|uniref:uroporphyrinogen-III C-methyltransferase n=1 Tax=Paraburkholderia fungorum TaxID=134537 RepID=A0AAJ3XIX7_9BURK|nr:uroporphyrinogen-III C-methyltransferase [Paraburkholderia fungorum]AJZ57883.1 uroporphyrinogen-III C-methyltransferase [Paraburkholderia fungorum]MBB5542967.1 uroporphyrin-III C-methyltransferase [Paraburkholderia fungorum]MBU7437470.1 uroporphyrinogen-III C-methyltransferase [Paraburkholderia fungorum]MDT8843352.1 uroporphyrinogen-III C-methyltransferase [Paraburkholderia fungorum]PNE55208.1 uroporphyrinogen-III C-methyltransferase [Paraburkholderia fungorum]
MGKVYLIGAGPGAADLITVRGARLLGMADVVLHDALVEPAMLDYAPAHARRIAVGKRCGQLSTAQQFINKQIVDAALEHDVVVRLKGGDPMLFGRADEEMRALEAAGIEYEVVPGITAALASAASLKRSLTLRGVSRSVALATHSRAADTEAIREQVNADSLVFYMGRDSGPEIAQQLIDAGRDGATPVAIVEACSTPRERTLTLTLSGLACGDAQQWLDASQPSLLMIGEAFAARQVGVGRFAGGVLVAA